MLTKIEHESMGSANSIYFEGAREKKRPDGIGGVINGFIGCSKLTRPRLYMLVPNKKEVRCSMHVVAVRARQHHCLWPRTFVRTSTY
jgi:hypothetical protein